MRGTLTRAGEPTPVVVDVAVDARGVHARSAEGSWTLDLRGLSLTGGGFEGNMVFCRDAAGELTVACSDPALLDALEALGDPRVHAALEGVRGQHRSHHRARRIGMGLAAGAIALLGALILGALWLAPRLLASGVDAVPVAVDRQLGDAAAGSLETGPEVEEPRVVSFVETVVQRLTPHAATDGHDLRARVVRGDTVNAYALPGGQIVVFTGLIAEAERPEQVAGVLAHEIAHVTLRHGMRNVAHRAGLMLAVSLLLGDQSGWVELAADMAILAQSNDYSREQEAAADAEGVRMLLAAGIDPRGLAELFASLAEAGDAELPGELSWLSTHPDHASRIAHVRALAAASDRETRPLDVDWAAVRAAAR